MLHHFKQYYCELSALESQKSPRCWSHSFNVTPKRKIIYLPFESTFTSWIMTG